MTIRVVLAEDHPPAREGIRVILEAAPDIEVLGEARDGVEAKKLVAQLHPDILLLDLGKRAWGIALPHVDHPSFFRSTAKVTLSEAKENVAPERCCPPAERAPRPAALGTASGGTPISSAEPWEPPPLFAQPTDPYTTF